jgi:hypothetical protein
MATVPKKKPDPREVMTYSEHLKNPFPEIQLMSPLKKTPREIELEAELDALREARKTRDEKILEARAAKREVEREEQRQRDLEVRKQNEAILRNFKIELQEFMRRYPGVELIGGDYEVALNLGADDQRVEIDWP